MSNLNTFNYALIYFPDNFSIKFGERIGLNVRQKLSECESSYRHSTTVKQDGGIYRNVLL